MKAVILAAGNGSRLALATEIKPKPMISLNGMPILEHNLMMCKNAGITSIYINTHHQSEIIKNYFGDGAKFGVTITYSYEPSLLGTSGAVKNFSAELDNEDFIVVYGDNYSNYDLNSIIKFHYEKNSDFTIASYPIEDVSSSGFICRNPDGLVEHFIEKPNFTNPTPGLANMGVYVINYSVLKQVPDGVSDFGLDIIPALLKNHSRVYSIIMSEKAWAIDTPHQLEIASKYFNN